MNAVIRKLRWARIDLVDFYYHSASLGSLPTVCRFLAQTVGYHARS